MSTPKCFAHVHEILPDGSIQTLRGSHYYRSSHSYSTLFGRWEPEQYTLYMSSMKTNMHTYEHLCSRLRMSLKAACHSIVDNFSSGFITINDSIVVSQSTST